MNSRRTWFAGLAGTALALALAATAFAYQGTVPALITVTWPTGTLACGVALTVSATVVDASSNPVPGQSVAWAFSASPSSSDTINTTPTTTDANGIATTTVTLACVIGNRTLTATVGGVSGGAVMGITSGGLPQTSTLSSGSPFDSLPMGTILALLAVLMGAGIMVRQIAFSRP